MAFLGCGAITAVHSRNLRQFRDKINLSYASRELLKAEEFRKRYSGQQSYGNYISAIDDPEVDAVVIAVPPRFHLELSLRALESGKHVLVEKPAYLTLADYEKVIESRNRAKRTVLVVSCENLSKCQQRAF